MGIRKPYTGLANTPAQHADHVHSVAQGGEPPPGLDEVSSSWQRSANQYRVDPVHAEAPRILTAHELKEARQPLEPLVFCAQDEIDRLHSLVREAGYTVLLCDSKGVAVDHRADDADKSVFKHWGIWLGAMWSETIEGTNGIGTSIVEERPVSVHRTQHFRSRHTDLSCSGAPVFDPDGTLTAVLDVSVLDPELSERAHALTGRLTVRAAGAIEERLFRERFFREWIVAVSAYKVGGLGMLLAVDGSQRVVGANRAARAVLLLDDRMLLAGVDLWSLFERDPTLFRRRDSADIPTQLLIAGSSESVSALITPPASAWGARRDNTSRMWHARPRLDLVSGVRQIGPASQASGGLPPGTMRRVCEYIEAHLGENIDLARLASVAGLSVFHFAREFKRSAGVTPHHYLVQRRIEKAQHLLARTQLTLAEIAVTTGFTDQSHLARHFRQMLGTTPSEYRWSQR